MREIVALSLCLIFVAGCANKPATNHVQQDTIPQRPTTMVEWETGTTYDFGVYTERVAKDYRFVFRNTGDVPLVIDSVKSMCGCTRATYDKRPVMPGDTGSIHMTYFGNGFSPGYFHQHCWVYANLKEPVNLELKGVFDHAE